MERNNHGKNYSTTSKAYKNFMEALVRRKVSNPGLHATLYFDAFWLEALSINKDSIINRKLVDARASRGFTEWRDQQKAFGLLDWVENGSHFGNGVRYIPGPITLKYLNALTITNAQIATKADVIDVRDQVDLLGQRVSKLESALGKLIDLKDPPVTGEKIEFYTSNPEALLN